MRRMHEVFKLRLEIVLQRGAGCSTVSAVRRRRHCVVDGTARDAHLHRSAATGAAATQPLQRRTTARPCRRRRS